MEMVELKITKGAFSYLQDMAYSKLQEFVWGLQNFFEDTDLASWHEDLGYVKTVFDVLEMDFWGEISKFYGTEPHQFVTRELVEGLFCEDYDSVKKYAEGVGRAYVA